MARYIPRNYKDGKQAGRKKKPSPAVKVRPEGLKDRYRLLVDVYFKNGCDMLNTLRELGYAPGYMDRIFKRPDVRALIAQRQQKMQQEAEVNFDWVMGRYKKLVLAIEALAKYKKVDEVGRLYHDFRGATEDELLAIGEMTTEERKEGRGEAGFYVMKSKFSERDYLALLRDMRRLGGLDKADESDKLVGDGLSLIERINKGRERAGKAKANAAG